MLYKTQITALILGLTCFTVQGGEISARKCCQRRLITCGPTPDIDNGLFDTFTSYGIVFGDEAKLVCNQGFEESEPTTITCQSNGEWSSFTATCDVITFGGTHYVQIYPRVTQIINGNTDERRLYLTSDSETHVNVTSTFTSLSEMVTVDGFYEIDINKAFDLEVSDVVNISVIEIKLDNPINVHGFSFVAGRSPVDNKIEIATEAWLARPVETCSSEYIIITTDQAPQFNIVGLVDGTTCTITGMADIQVDRLEVYTFFVDSIAPGVNNDLSGKIIDCTNAVCVWSGGWFSNVPLGRRGTRDMNTVQLLGVDRWPNKCVFGRFEPREEFGIKVVASIDNTNVVIDRGMGVAGEINVNLNRGDAVDQFFNFAANVEAVLITADKPFLAVQFSVKLRLDLTDDIGDSSMIQCVDPDNFQSRYLFQLDNTDNDQFDEYRLRLVIDETKADQLRLNNTVLSPSTDKDATFSSTGEQFTFITIEVFKDILYEVKTLDGTPFGADAYGKRRIAQFTKSLGQLYNS